MKRRAISGFAAALLAFSGTLALADSASSQPLHILKGFAARALALGFRDVGAAGGSGFTVRIADLGTCYRYRYVLPGNPPAVTTLRFGKPVGSGQNGPCVDSDTTEQVLTGTEATAIVRLIQAWSASALDGAPPLEMLANNEFDLAERIDGERILLVLGTAEHPGDNCYTPRWAYAFDTGNLTRADRTDCR